MVSTSTHSTSSTAHNGPRPDFEVNEHEDHHPLSAEGKNANDIEPAEKQVAAGGQGGRPKLEKYAYTCGCSPSSPLAGTIKPLD